MEAACILIFLMLTTAAALRSSLLPDLFIEADCELSTNVNWQVPLLLAKGMMDGVDVDVPGPMSPRLAASLPQIQALYEQWVPRARRIEVRGPLQAPAPSRGVSAFFSGGVDSFHTLIAHRDEIDNIILIHGFDIPLADTRSFGLAEAQARSAAELFGKRLIVVRTNMHWELTIPFDWKWYHGPSLASIVHALAPMHRKVYIASSHSYAELHPWGSNALLDPLWSSEAVEVVHDSGATRLDKLRLLASHPGALSRLRVCWENLGNYNCGECEKCVRTMIALFGLGLPHSEAFPDTLTPKRVRALELPYSALPFWREIETLDLPPDFARAVRSAMTSSEYRLPPHTGTFRREVKRALYGLRQMARIARAVAE
jgi:hypothetical protein